MSDRTDFIPNHGGDLVLPCDPLFTRLLTIAHRPDQRPAIRDLNTGVERTTCQLLVDVIRLRRVLKSALKPNVLKDLKDGKEVFINILAPGGYEFAVGILAALALGAAASTISTVQPVKEALYYAQRAKSVAVLAATPAIELGQALERAVKTSTNSDFVCVPIASYQEQPQISIKDVLISSNKYQDPNSAGIVIFTSGTTGPPKGAVLRRAAISDGALGFAEQIRIEDTSVILHLLPVHHATGIWVSFFPFIQTGACIEFKSGSFDPQWTWDRFKRGGITHFSGVPTIYMRMMRHYQQHLTKLPASELEPYTAAPSQFKVMLCGTSALPQPINAFWTHMMQGRRIVQRYGSTEAGVVFNMPFTGHDDIPDGSVGEKTLGVDMKLAGDDPEEGEILVRSFNMFCKYLHDPAATAAAHTSDGYFRTGDIARRQGKYYFIVGRASVDIIKSGGYKISALDVERELLALPYLNEVMVVGVPDEEFGQRVGAVVSLRHDQLAHDFYRTHHRDEGTLRISDLRSDARDRLAGYKMPTLLRVIEGELPKSPSGKVVKKVLGPEYFPPDYHSIPDVQVWTPDRQKRQTASTKL